MIIDILVAVVLFLSALVAFVRGFIREVLTIAGVVGGLAAAWFFSPMLFSSFRGFLGVDPDPETVNKLMGIIPMGYVADGVAYFAVFIVVVIAISIFSHFMAEGVKSMGMGAIDRTFGVVFGLVRGVLLLGLFYLPFYLFMDQESKTSFFAESQTHFYLETVSGFLSGFLPESADEVVREQAQNVEDAAAAKEQLQGGLDLLNKVVPSEAVPAPDGEPQPGYQEPFRDEMNDLFRQQQVEE